MGTSPRDEPTPEVVLEWGGPGDEVGDALHELRRRLRRRGATRIAHLLGATLEAGCWPSGRVLEPWALEALLTDLERIARYWPLTERRDFS